MLAATICVQGSLHGAEWTPSWWVEDASLAGSLHQKRLVWLRERGHGVATFVVVFGQGGTAYQVTCRDPSGEITKVERCWIKFSGDDISMGTIDPFPCTGAFILAIAHPTFTAPFIPALYLSDMPASFKSSRVILAHESKGFPPFKLIDNPGLSVTPIVRNSWNASISGDPNSVARVRILYSGDNISDMLMGIALDTSLNTRPPEPSHWMSRMDFSVCEMTLPWMSGSVSWDSCVLKGSNAFHVGDVISYVGSTQLISATASTTSDKTKDKGISPKVTFSYQLRVAGVFASKNRRVALLTSRGADTSLERPLNVSYQSQSSEGDPMIHSFSSCGTWSFPDPKLPPIFLDDRSARFQASLQANPFAGQRRRIPMLWCYVLDVETGALLALRGYAEDREGELKPSTSVSFDGGHVGMLLSRNFQCNQDSLQASSWPGQRKASAHLMLKPVNPLGFDILDLGTYQLKLLPLVSPFTRQMLWDGGYAVPWSNAKPPYTAKPLNFQVIFELTRGIGKDLRSKYFSQILNNTYGSWSTQRGINPFYLMLHDGKGYFSCQTWGNLATPTWTRLTTLDLKSNTLTEITLSTVVRRGCCSQIPLLLLETPPPPKYEVGAGPPPRRTSKPDPEPPPTPPKVELPGKY